MSTSKIIELDESNTCGLCHNALAKYSCPKCNVKYCCLVCYKSESHLDCSEEFYKNCIVEELESENSNGASKQEMIEILKRLHQSNREEETIETNDSDDDDDVDDLSKRLAGVDLDNADQIWTKLTSDEQQEFLSFIKSGDVTKLVPKWTPWWVQNARKVQDQDKVDGKVPEIVKIQKFTDISKKKPAECVKYNLVNVLSAYVFILRYFNGETDDFINEAVTSVIAIAATMKTNENFHDFDTAVKSVEVQCTNSEWIMADSENFSLLHDDVMTILKGPKFHAVKKSFMLCALSDLSRLFKKALTNKTSVKNGEDGKSTRFGDFCTSQLVTPTLEKKSKIKNCLRKLDYFLSFCKYCDFDFQFVKI